MNEIINMIPYFFSVLLSTIFCNLCYIKLNDHKLKINIKNIVIILITSVLVFINNSYDNLWLKFICIPITSCISYKLLYKDNFKKIIITYIFLFGTTILIEIIFSNIFNVVGFINNYAMVLSYTISKIILSTLISVLQLILVSVKIINKISKQIINFFNNINVVSILYLLFIPCYILGMINIENFANKGSMKLIMLLCILFLLLFSLVIKSKTKEEYLKKYNKKLIDYNEKYGQFLDEYKIYKHNIKHKLAGIKTYGNKKVNELIDDLLEEETTFSIKNNELYNIPNGIKGIVAEKLYSTNINVIIDNKVKGDPFSRLKPREFNSISESIGICLDNALEASEETIDPVIVMDLYEDKKNIFVKIGNNFINSIDIEEIGSKYYSTKNRGSGIGLFSIIQNKKIKEKISIINDIYYIELKIKKHAD